MSAQGELIVELIEAKQKMLEENERLNARVNELENGFTLAMRDLDQDLPRFHALYAVLDGVVKSVDDYDAYLAYQLKDGAKP